MRGGQRGQEGFEHAEFGGNCAAVIHVDLVFAGPMKGFAIRDFQSREVNAVAAVKLEVALGKIPAHDADEVDGGEEAGGDGRVAGGATEQARIAGLGGFDGVKGGGTDDQHAHRFYVEIIQMANHTVLVKSSGTRKVGEARRSSEVQSAQKCSDLRGLSARERARANFEL